MPTVDLSSPPPAPPAAEGSLHALPRRVTLSLAELRHVARAAGGAPLPFETAERVAPTLEGRLGRLRGGAEDAAYAAALGSLHDPADSLARRGLLDGDRVDDGLAGAVGLLATPEVALDLDLAVGTARARAWHRQAGAAVATLATADGLVFELAWLGVDQWPLELARVAVLPEDVATAPSGVPAVLEAPYELLDTAGEAARAGRLDLLPVLVAQHHGALRDEDGRPLDEAASVAALTALSQESRGRLRALVADVSGPRTTVAGVVSWVLLADGWHALRPRGADAGHRVEVARVEPAGLATDLAPVLARVQDETRGRAQGEVGS